MKLITQAIMQKLKRNSAETLAAKGKSLGHKPVLKVFNPFGAATWLFTEIDEDGILYGLCDLGMGEPELGYASFDELMSIRVMGCPLERDHHFRADKTLVEYANDARIVGRIDV